MVLQITECTIANGIVTSQTPLFRWSPDVEHPITCCMAVYIIGVCTPGLARPSIAHIHTPSLINERNIPRNSFLHPHHRICYMRFLVTRYNVHVCGCDMICTLLCCIVGDVLLRANGQVCGNTVGLEDWWDLWVLETFCQFVLCCHGSLSQYANTKRNAMEYGE